MTQPPNIIFVWTDPPKGPEEPSRGGWDQNALLNNVPYVRLDPIPRPQTQLDDFADIIRLIREADGIARDLGWHRIYDRTSEALEALEARQP